MCENNFLKKFPLRYLSNIGNRVFFLFWQKNVVSDFPLRQSRARHSLLHRGYDVDVWRRPDCRVRAVLRTRTRTFWYYLFGAS